MQGVPTFGSAPAFVANSELGRPGSSVNKGSPFLRVEDAPGDLGSSRIPSLSDPNENVLQGASRSVNINLANIDPTTSQDVEGGYESDSTIILPDHEGE